MKKDPKQPSKPLKLKKETVRELPKKAAAIVKGGRAKVSWAPPYIPVCP